MSQDRRVPVQKQRATPQRSVVAGAYPNVAKWVKGYGWIELGDDLAPLERRSFIRAVDEGGLIWAGEESYPTLDAALRDLDDSLGTWMREQAGE